MGHSLGLSRDFVRHVKHIWLKYLKCWKDKPLIGVFSNDRRGGLQLDKKSNIKRFEFFTQKQLETYFESLKSTPKTQRADMRNKEYLTKVKDIYYQLRYDKSSLLGSRK
mmetsp:Transcript_16559/g.19160  ORF Transcript_16559/g.19160 Transcript_16559/m.19160 type:complete len:109 (-) Transcript_16559:238-564(-)